MRYIGNKTRLLGFITSAVDRLGIPCGTVHDAFAGTSAVGRALKERGWRVASSDLMTYSYVFQRAYVVAQREPSIAELRAGDPDLRRALRSSRFRSRIAARDGPLGVVAEYLEKWLDPTPGFFTTHFAGERMYFTRENAQRIDTIRTTLHRWRSEGLIGDDAYFLLLAALIEGADRVANTAGVYAAYIKSWQPNALRPLRLEPLHPMKGIAGSTAHRDDAVAVARTLGSSIDLLYVDPPYNSRQYPGYYHVPELIARGWTDAIPTLRGKTGLLPADGQRSAWCSARRVRLALKELLEATGARHVLISYNSEGLLSERVLKETVRNASIDGRVACFRKTYRRYRADSDRDGRRYRADGLRELLVYARLRS